MGVEQGSTYRSIWADLRGVAFSQGWIDVGGVSTRYLHAGDKDKPALIFLHGVGGHAEAYVRNLKAHSSHLPEPGGSASVEAIRPAVQDSAVTILRLLLSR